MRYLGVLALFTLGNSSDAFLLLRAQEAGVALALLPALWALHHLVKAGASTWGVLSPTASAAAGRSSSAGAPTRSRTPGSPSRARRCRSRASSRSTVSSTLSPKGAERALVADLAPGATRGRAFGLFHAVTGAALLPASLLTGLLWQRFGAPVALGTGAGLAALAALGLLALVPDPAGRTAPRG